MELKPEKNISLAGHTTLKVGGPAEYFVTVGTVDELRAALKFAAQTSVPPLIIGGGSNLLINDNGYQGLVIKNSIAGRSYEEQSDFVQVTCGAGELLDDVVADTVSRGYWGLENLSAIPGTVGAAPIQNVGAYGVEVAALITEVTAMHINSLTEKVFTNQACSFSYRDSFFKTEVGREWVVTRVVFKLSTKANPRLEYGALQSLKEKTTLASKDVRVVVCDIRSDKFPDWHQVGTAGSFFKNPIIANELYEKLKSKYPEAPGYSVGEKLTKVPLGWILDNVCQLRGYCREGVCLYEKQALVLVNESAKNASVIDEFADYVADKVKTATGIKIEREVRTV